MSSKKFENDSYCVNGRHRSATVKFYGDLTSKVSKALIGYCSKCNRKKSMTVGDNTIQAEALVTSSKLVVKRGLNVSKKWQKTC